MVRVGIVNDDGSIVDIRRLAGSEPLAIVIGGDAMGHENLDPASLRDRIAEIVSDHRRPAQTTGHVSPGDYAVADQIIALVRAAPESE